MKYAVGLLLIVVLALGCTGTKPDITENDGLTINSFIVDPNDIDSGRDFRASLIVSNTGGATANDVKAQLIGVSWNNDIRTADLGTMSPPDVLRRVEGATQIFVWPLKAPELPIGNKVSYPLRARVTYNYKTTSVINIPVYSEDEARRKELSASAFNSIEYTNSNGPMKVSVTGPNTGYVTVRDPRLEVENPGPDENIYFSINLDNLGSGVPITNDKTNLIVGEIKTLDNTEIKCTRDDGGQAGSQIISYLRSGRNSNIPCTLVLDRNEWIQTGQGTVSLLVTLEYDYYIEKSDTISVSGRGISGSGYSGSNLPNYAGLDNNREPLSNSYDDTIPYLESQLEESSRVSDQLEKERAEQWLWP